MTTTPLRGIPTTPPVTVTVLLGGRAVALADGVRAALAAGPGRQTLDWRLFPATGFDEPSFVGPDSVDIAVCDGPSTVRALRGRWPGATVVALVAARDDGTDTVATLKAGADVSIRGDDAGLVAAYLQSVVRRRGLPAVGASR